MFDLLLVAALVIAGLSFLMLAVGVFGLIRAVKQASKQQRTLPRYMPESVDHRLQADLLVLVGGNRGTANRLLSQVKSTNPGRTAGWCFEKAIHDLERDRH